MLPELFNRARTEGNRFLQRVSGSSAVAARKAAPLVTEYTAAEMRDLMLSGDIYKTVKQGGARRDVLKLIGRTCANDATYPMVPHYNPVPQIVRFYANSFGGRWGETLKLVNPEGNPLDDRIALPIMRISRWSNLDTRADEMTSTVANHGTVGLRVVLRTDPTPRVHIDFDDQQFISHVELDSRGNVIAVYLEYSEVERDPVTGAETYVEVKETISKYGFSKLRDGKESLSDEARENPLGVCPYVLLRLKTRSGQAFGIHAYEGIETSVHALNFALSQLDESEIQHVWPYIFSTSAAAKPTKLDVGRFTLIHSQNREGMPPSTFDPMVPDLDFAGVLNFAKERVGWIQERQPQLAVTSLPMLSNLSGEALSQMLVAAEAECIRARAVIEDAVTRAIQIGLSLGIVAGIEGFDLGTGMGTVEAANRAYDDGQGAMAFGFARRRALPPTALQIQQQATADVAEKKAKLEVAKAAKAIGLPDNEVWRLSGYDEEADFPKLKQELRAQSTLGGTDLDDDLPGVPEEEPEVLA